ncbi:MAG TPA: hypothetical protein VF226_20100 [Hyphomicrobiaceae bacterium]|jgi:hypothetical protein
MPQVIALLLAGAGLYAGCRWVSREVRRALATAQEAEERLRQQSAPKDLGSLEWDAEAGVYRPSKQA